MRKASRLLRTLMATKALITFVLAVPAPAVAHGGRTNAQGCHNDRQNGGYHCHGGSGGGSGRSSAMGLLGGSGAGGGAYRNCAAARAAGAAPVRRGDAGYGRHLDRDGDGVGCE
jgi:hypothetical protein